ncbi:MAG: hypothetical protein OEQ18_12480 [Gammaproteobacteria bacterium]|nr:hypothetical protein [Gammaproteobacteria bacterium]
MEQRVFELRLSSTLAGPENEPAYLHVEVLHDGTWEPLHLNVKTRGFLIFVNAAFICQHMYLRVNAAERGLLLDAVDGEFTMITSEDWLIRDIHASFQATLRSGHATEADIAFIVERMKACPVSRNLKEPPTDTRLNFI